jgi:hypothetical protein
VTETPRPSETPAPTNTQVAVADQPDTAPGSVLEVGQEWVQNGMAMRLKSPTFAASCDGFLEFELTIQNNAGQELVVNINGNDFSLTDDQGRAYSNNDIWWDEGPSTTRCYGSTLDHLDLMTMTPGQRMDIAVRVRGDPAANVSQFTFAVYRAGRIQDAQWVIIVPR